MTTCRHKNLVRLPGSKKKLRCKHCHLTIDSDELESDYCPECMEIRGIKNRDFEEIEPENNGIETYRCEDCGALIEVP
jgi:Zn finger protein HypA/HybF involved in hydrogenase expression